MAVENSLGREVTERGRCQRKMSRYLVLCWGGREGERGEGERGEGGSEVDPSQPNGSERSREGLGFEDWDSGVRRGGFISGLNLRCAAAVAPLLGVTMLCPIDDQMRACQSTTESGPAGAVHTEGVGRNPTADVMCNIEDWWFASQQTPDSLLSSCFSFGTPPPKKSYFVISTSGGPQLFSSLWSILMHAFSVLTSSALNVNSSAPSSWPPLGNLH